MAHTLLFCTANIPTEVLDSFLTQSTLPRSAPSNAWLLVRSPNEPISGPALTPPVPAFQTGFENASVETIQQFITTHVPTTDQSFPNVSLYISPTTFAVLDSRSIADGTVSLYHLHSRMPDEALEEDEEAWDESLLIREWKEWRVRFLTAWFVANRLFCQPGSLYEDFEIGREEYFDERGVLQCPGFEHDAFELPDLREDERVPWGEDDGEKEDS